MISVVNAKDLTVDECAPLKRYGDVYYVTGGWEHIYPDVCCADAVGVLEPDSMSSVLFDMKRGRYIDFVIL